MSGSEGELPIFVKWMEFLKWLMPALEKFPKKARFTVTNRIAGMALDVAELLVEARYSKEKRHILRKANITLEKMRILWRIAHDGKLCPTKFYRFAGKSIDEVGMMLGGWLKERDGA